MAPGMMRRKNGPKKSVPSVRSLKKQKATEDVDKLAKRVEELDPKTAEPTAFSDLPLSQPTLAGLDASHFKTPTDIQAKAVPFALKARDILGAARTGSGKTLAFLIPVLENLYRQKWTELDGLGALIVSPTRELAIQIFEVLRKIGRYHSFSAGLVIGGRSLQEERERLGRMNILVCTPGRMLQHMDQTATFEVDNLQMLVLDEADRILDMGFQSSLDAILDHLPTERQTILFSATQTRKVSDLARLSLREPEYIAVHEAAPSATPAKLQQHYILTPLPEKLNTLYSFIKTNLKAKILVFLSSGKQVRFVYESFRHLQPGIPLLHLHGRQNQTARLDISSKFATSKNACLFATDVVARGLDFPAVDWVIQLDCPEDADTYIHRVGRTARFEKEGRAVLFLDPSEEEGMLKRLEQKKVPIQKISVRQKKQQSIQNQLQNMCFQNPDLKYVGQKAFISYAKSIFIQKDKEIFDIQKLDLEGFSASLGLPGAPKIKFQKGDDAKKLKNTPRALLQSSDDESETDAKPKKTEVRTKYDRMFERQNQDVLSSHYSKIIAEEGDSGGDDDDDDDDFLSVKRVIAADELEEDGTAALGPQPKTIDGLGENGLVVDSKRREKLLKSKKKLAKLKGKGTKLVFDDDGTAHAMYELTNEDDFRKGGEADEQRAAFVASETARVQQADIDDKEVVRLKRREKKLKRKAREAAEQEMEDGQYRLPDDGEEEDPLALMRSLPLAGEDDEDDGDSTRGQNPQKRPRKWFDDDDDDEAPRSKKHHREPADAEPETLEDLEALAAGLLE